MKWLDKLVKYVDDKFEAICKLIIVLLFIAALIILYVKIFMGGI